MSITSLHTDLHVRFCQTVFKLIVDEGGDLTEANVLAWAFGTGVYCISLSKLHV